MTTPAFLENGPADAAVTLALAHGAGAAMDTPFMDAFAEAIAASGGANGGAGAVRVVRFEFPYMVRRREDGNRRPPDRQPVLLDTWRAVVAALGDASRLVIGGKSMGGRMASLVADELNVAGLICLGYPFHPLGKPDRLRVDHLTELRTPTLIVQGERDAMGRRDEVETYPLAPSIELHWLPDGDHSFVPRKSSGITKDDNWRAGAAACSAFLSTIAR